MTSFANAILSDNLETTTKTVTENGMPTYVSTDDAVLDFFGIAGSSRGKDISSVFLNAYRANPLLTVKALFNLRDIRGGAGERDTFRKLVLLLEQQHPATLELILALFPVYGRWDDLCIFVTDRMKTNAATIYANALRAGDKLAAKWAPRKGEWANLIRKSLKLDPKSYRKLIVSNSQTVETQMCANQFDNINYEHVPSIAASRYQKAFNRHDPVRYSEFKAKAVKGEAKVNAGAIFPHDIIKSVKHGDQIAALAQWQNLPNYLGEDFILPMVDVSGSMSESVGGNPNLQCIDVAVSLGLYLADKQTGAFKDMFLTFSTDPKIQILKGNLLEKLNAMETSHWDMSTNIEKAFREILRVAVMNQVPQSEMPKMIVVLTDLEFNDSSNNQMAMDMASSMYAKHNYLLPKIVWWNLRARANATNNPVKKTQYNTAFVSGFSSNILKSVMSCKSMSPLQIMLDTLNSDRYNLVEQFYLKSNGYYNAL